MRLKRGLGIVWILCGIFFFFLTGIVYGQSATVTIGVGDTILSVSGKTSPNAFVTINKNGNVIGTAVANNIGEYSQTFPAQDPGLIELRLFAHTTSGENTDTVSINVNIAEHATTSVEVFLPSTVLVEDATLAYGQHLVMSGETAPLSTVAIYIDNNMYATTSTNSLGLWSISLQTTLLTPGQHEFFVRVTDGFGNQSYPTSVRLFSLAAQVTKPGEPSSQPPRPSRSTSHAPPIGFPQPNGSTIPLDQPLLIRIPRSHFTVYQYHSVSLRAFVLNGWPSYSTNIEWGDAVNQKNVFRDKSLSFSHTYAKPGSYTVAVDVQDAEGRKARIYFSVDVKPSTANAIPDFLLFIFLLLVTVICFLLGRRERKKH